MPEKQTNPIVVHHLEYSQSFRIVWLMEELGVPYELKIYERDKKTNLASDEYKTVSPLGTSPVMTHGDVTMAESNAIIDYVLDVVTPNKLRPRAGSKARADYLFWFHAAQGSLMPLLLMDIVHTIAGQNVPRLIRPLTSAIFKKIKEIMIAPRMARLLDKAEVDLAAHQWFAGDKLTAADITMSYCMDAAESRGYLGEDRPNCRRWLADMRDYPSYKAALAKDPHGKMLFEL